MDLRPYKMNGYIKLLYLSIVNAPCEKVMILTLLKKSLEPVWFMTIYMAFCIQ